MSKVIICEQCGKSKPKYANGLCKQCYQSNYRKENKIEFDEPKSDDDLREECNQPSRYTHKECHFCGANIGQKFPWCKKCSIKYGLYGVDFKDWPEWARFLKKDLDREEYDDWKHSNHTVGLENDRGEPKRKVSKVSYDKYLAGTNEQHLDRSDISMEQLLRKYDIPIEELEILTTSNLKAHAAKIGIPYHTVRRMKEKLDQKWTWRMIALMMPPQEGNILEFKHDLSGCR